MSKISAIITAHREGSMVGVSLRSMLDSVQHARALGIEVDICCILDNADDATASFFENDKIDWRVYRVDMRDQGLVRNFAVEQADGEYIAFLDGDDLWSLNWLSEAYNICLRDPGKIISHPEFNWFFEKSSNIFVHVDQSSTDFDPAFLRIGNYWDALCMAPRDAYRTFPFAKREIKEGFAYEDWQWNCEVLCAGFVHRLAPDTIHFKRRRSGSQTLDASGRRALTRGTPLYQYSWYS